MIEQIYKTLKHTIKQNPSTELIKYLYNKNYVEMFVLAKKEYNTVNISFYVNLNDFYKNAGTIFKENYFIRISLYFSINLSSPVLSLQIFDTAYYFYFFSENTGSFYVKDKDVVEPNLVDNLLEVLYEEIMFEDIISSSTLLKHGIII